MILYSIQHSPAPSPVGVEVGRRFNVYHSSVGQLPKTGDHEVVAGDVFVRREEQNNLVFLVFDRDNVQETPERTA